MAKTKVTLDSKIQIPKFVISDETAMIKARRCVKVLENFVDSADAKNFKKITGINHRATPKKMWSAAVRSTKNPELLSFGFNHHGQPAEGLDEKTTQALTSSRHQTPKQRSGGGFLLLDAHARAQGCSWPRLHRGRE